MANLQSPTWRCSATSRTSRSACATRATRSSTSTTCSSACCSRAASSSRRRTATGSATRSSRRSMHEASFELIEIPHVRMSGKNSADIRMVVDALDLCYTKSHVDTFVIVSGDSDFSPLVSKLRENNKIVIGVGVKSSTSDLLIANCDEFIYYDDLVRKDVERRTRKKRRRDRDASRRRRHTPPRRLSARPGGRERCRPRTRRDGFVDAATPPKSDDERKQEAFDLVLDDDRGAGRRARRGREDLGLDDQAGDQAPATRVQRVLPRLPQLQRAARGSAVTPSARSRKGREVRAATSYGRWPDPASADTHLTRAAITDPGTGLCSPSTPGRGFVSAKQAVNEGTKYRLGVTTIRVVKIEAGPHGGPISQNPL